MPPAGDGETRRRRTHLFGDASEVHGQAELVVLHPGPRRGPGALLQRPERLPMRVASDGEFLMAQLITGGGAT